MLKHQGNIEAWQLPSVDKLDCLPKKINREVKWSLGKVVQTCFHTQEYIITYALQMRAYHTVATILKTVFVKQLLFNHIQPGWLSGIMNSKFK